jgi:hypothetical protein
MTFTPQLFEVRRECGGAHPLEYGDTFTLENFRQLQKYFPVAADVFQQKPRLAMHIVS